MGCGTAVMFVGWVLASYLLEEVRYPGLAPVEEEGTSLLRSHSFCSPSGSVEGVGDLSGVAPRRRRRVLILCHDYSGVQALTHLLEEVRVPYKVWILGEDSLDTLPWKEFALLLFQDFKTFVSINLFTRKLIFKYCSEYSVGIIVSATHQTPLPLKITNDSIFQRHNSLRNLFICPHSQIPNILKASRTLYETLDSYGFLSFTSRFLTKSTTPVLEAMSDSGPVTIVLHDRGQVPKIIFASNPLSHWLLKLLFLDSITFLSHQLINLDTKRWVLIDVDDIFVGKNRLSPSDVRELVISQDKLRKNIYGFKYNLGFSGYYFRNQGSSLINKEGDAALIEKKHHFWWFPHTFRHLQPHMFNSSLQLEQQMFLNKKFALEYKLPVNFHYAVAPHHSGVYPVHKPLYDAWKNVWGIVVTSTEEYPHLKPSRLRRGFTHDKLKILPRQTCGLFTKNIYYEDYPKNPEVLEKSIRGGELFQTISFNSINIFMTHMSNYGFDRLAPYTFESVFSMLKCWTNLKFVTVNPEKLSEIYFSMFPDEKVPIWGNPCYDSRLKEIWSKNKNCKRLPNFLVIGPQKTGTTALYNFLKIHPSIISNNHHSKYFEEVQFFSSSDYLKGIDWYMSFFPDNVKINDTLVFEKSATYFDKGIVPLRVSNLLPEASLISIIISPIKRAYSWYYHSRAHKDPAAISNSFFDIISANSTSSKVVRVLQSRCLEPGKYFLHFERWMHYFKSRKILIIDGEKLRYTPANVMEEIQKFLNIRHIINYEEELVFDPIKGFFCQHFNLRKISF
uniref:[heparan sulfate]-glucosamine N-sulfotransferase n=1 Tax=Lepeophtheirus salmonis TaxID=72036 RepID=A0A0K2UYH4_LEPSM